MSILKQYEGKKPKAMETMKAMAMATAIGYGNGYWLWRVCQNSNNAG